MSERVRAHAPGRVNLIGEHVDYAGGLALPIAVDLGTTVLAQRGHERVVLSSRSFDGVAEVALDVDDPAATEPEWARLVAGVVAELRPETGFVGEVATTIPVGAGLSSSAALEVAIALALLGVDGAPRTDEQRIALAQQCQRAEHRASGVPCGVMDQLASLCGVAGHALLIDFHALSVEPVAWPPGAEIVVIDSGERRDLRASGYAERRAEVGRAEDVVGPLRQATVADLDRIDDPSVRARARHVVTEIDRVRRFATSIGRGDLRDAGRLMLESHASLRDDHQVSTSTLDAIVDHLEETKGVYGARLTGGGWGGCVVALAEPGALDLGTVVTPADGASVDALS